MSTDIRENLLSAKKNETQFDGTERSDDSHRSRKPSYYTDRTELIQEENKKFWFKPSLLEDASKGVLRKLILISLVCVFFIAVEIIGGTIAGSLAILSDAAHLASDLIGFFFSIVAV